MRPAPRNEVVRARLQRQRRQDTEPEYRLRRMLHSAGLRYRVGYPVPEMTRRSIDVAFPGHQVAVFVDGCYWHRCPVHHVPAKNNSEWWARKLESNVLRDAETSDHLRRLGWIVLRFWEHEDVTVVAEVVRDTVVRRRGEALAPPTRERRSRRSPPC